MSYHPRIESKEYASLVTTRSRNSELWFINNQPLENAILGYLAKVTQRYGVKLYAAAIEGNHMHELAQFPQANRSSFARDLNSVVAKLVPRFSKDYPGGRFWGRRFSNELVPDADDIEEWFFYVVLQPVQDGLVDRISDYPGYNCFNDAVNGRVRKFEVVNWSAYNEARRWRRDVNIRDFTDEVELRYERIPGYEHLTQTEYKKLMLQKLEEHRVEAIKRRGTPSVGPALLRTKRQGSLPESTKTGTRTSHRPRVLCICPIRRQHYLRWYFDIYSKFKEASAAYRSGESDVRFPPGTYKPPLFTCAALKATA